jgi:hypothetical protein
MLEKTADPSPAPAAASTLPAAAHAKAAPGVTAAVLMAFVMMLVMMKSTHSMFSITNEMRSRYIGMCSAQALFRYI